MDPWKIYQERARQEWLRNHASDYGEKDKKKEWFKEWSSKRAPTSEGLNQKWLDEEKQQPGRLIKLIKQGTGSDYVVNQFIELIISCPFVYDTEDKKSPRLEKIYWMKGSTDEYGSKESLMVYLLIIKKLQAVSFFFKEFKGYENNHFFNENPEYFRLSNCLRSDYTDEARALFKRNLDYLMLYSKDDTPSNIYDVKTLEQELYNDKKWSKNLLQLNTALEEREAIINFCDQVWATVSPIYFIYDQINKLTKHVDIITCNLVHYLFGIDSSDHYKDNFSQSPQAGYVQNNEKFEKLKGEISNMIKELDLSAWKLNGYFKERRNYELLYPSFFNSWTRDVTIVNDPPPSFITYPYIKETFYKQVLLFKDFLMQIAQNIKMIDDNKNMLEQFNVELIRKRTNRTIELMRNFVGGTEISLNELLVKSPPTKNDMLKVLISSEFGYPNVYGAEIVTFRKEYVSITEHTNRPVESCSIQGGGHCNTNPLVVLLVLLLGALMFSFLGHTSPPLWLSDVPFVFTSNAPISHVTQTRQSLLSLA